MQYFEIELTVVVFRDAMGLAEGALTLAVEAQHAQLARADETATSVLRRRLYSYLKRLLCS